MTDEEERATDARLEHAPARVPSHSLHRMLAHVFMSAHTL
jgi:hypothetical protein